MIITQRRTGPAPMLREPSPAVATEPWPSRTEVTRPEVDGSAEDGDHNSAHTIDALGV